MPYLEFNQREIEVLELSLGSELDSIQEWMDGYSGRADLSHIKSKLLGNRVIIGMILRKLRELAKAA